MKIKTTFLLACCLLLGTMLHAQTVNNYYVDGSKAINGDGSQANPWNVISSAIYRARDTTKDAVVYIKRGTYTIDPAISATQLFIDNSTGGANGKYFVLRTYAGDEGKVFIDGSKLTTNPFYPNMLVLSGAKFVRLQNLVFLSLKNTNGYVLNIQNAQNIEIKNCAFDTLRWTTNAAEYGYPTVNNVSNFIHPIYLANSSIITISNDTLRNAALGWGEFVKDAGGNTGVSTSGFITTGLAPIATNYYVSVTGNDTTGTGSIAKPWRTLKKANEVAGINYTYSPSRLINAPVTINLRAGVHKPIGNGLFIGSNRGVNKQWFTIRNYPGENAILDGSNITSKFSALISISDAKYIRIEGLKLTKMTNDSALRNALPSIGIKDTRFGIIVSGKSSNIIIKKNSIYDMAWTRNVAKQKTPANNDNVGPLVILGTTDTSIRNVIIDSNNVYNNVPGYSEAVTVNGNVDSFAIINNFVYDNANIGIVAAGNYKWIVDDPTFTVTTPYNFSKNGFILNNATYRNISPIALSAGIYLDGSRNVKVENNESYNNGVGISIGNEQDSSISGYHLVNLNVFRDNLESGIYYGSTNKTSWVERCVVMNNTVKNNFLVDPVLRARANGMYGINDTTQRSVEVTVNRLRNSRFEQNVIESLSDKVLALLFEQVADTFRYNTYYIISENACNAIFLEDKNKDGGIQSIPLLDSTYKSFHQYVKKSGYDLTSSCEGQNYNPNGCGTTPLARAKNVTEELAVVDKNARMAIYPNPVTDVVTINLGKLVKKGNITVVDAAGRVLLQRVIINGFTERINVKALGLKAQLLIIKVSDGAATTIHKLMVQQ
jgi:parallel beta-helix repeat protein